MGLKGGEDLNVSKTISLDAKQIVDIENAIIEGKANNMSDFIQKAVKHYLNSLN